MAIRLISDSEIRKIVIVLVVVLVLEMSVADLRDWRG
jgi:hypothetical protein